MEKRDHKRASEGDIIFLFPGDCIIQHNEYKICDLKINLIKYSILENCLVKKYNMEVIQPMRFCALRALGLLLADGALTAGRGKTF